MASKQISLGRTVDPATGITRTENRKKAPFKGKLTQAIIQFPPGCDGLVYVKLGVNNVELTDWIHLDGTVQNLQLNFPVLEDDFIWAEIFNYDSTYPHSIGITVTLIGD